MAYLSIAAAGDAMKTFFKSGFVTQLNEEASPTVTQIERTSEHVEGVNIKVALRYGRSGGVGNRAETDTLPTPNARKTKQATWETKNIFARMYISDKLIRASRTSVGAFANMMETTMRDAEVDAKDSVARQMFGDGTGLLATIAVGGIAGNVMTVDTVDGIAEGMFLDSYDKEVPATKHLSAVEVVAVDEDAKTVEVTDIGTAEVEDTLYVTGNKGIELTGFKAYFRATELCGLDRATYPWFKATRKDMGSAEISETKMWECIHAAENKAGSRINLINCSYGVYRAYGNLLLAYKRQTNTQVLKGGWEALDFAGHPLVAERHQSTGLMQFYDLSDWNLEQLDEWDWLDDDGAVLHRVSDRPVWEATLVKYCDLACNCPRGQVELYNILEH